MAHARIAALPKERQPEALRRLSRSYSAPDTCIRFDGCRREGDVIAWPDGEWWPVRTEIEPGEALWDLTPGTQFQLCEKMLGVSCGESRRGIVLAERPDPLFYNGVCVQFDESGCVSVVHGKTRVLRFADDLATATPQSD